MTERQSPVTRANHGNRVLVQNTNLLGACFQDTLPANSPRAPDVVNLAPRTGHQSDRRSSVPAARRIGASKLAEVMPRADQLTIIRNRSVSASANSCCRPWKATPQARFDVEMDRLNTIINERNEPDLGD